jgi:hypothetical protein
MTDCNPTPTLSFKIILFALFTLVFYFLLVFTSLDLLGAATNP